MPIPMVRIHSDHWPDGILINKSKFHPEKHVLFGQQESAVRTDNASNDKTNINPESTVEPSIPSNIEPTVEEPAIDESDSKPRKRKARI